MISSWIVKLTKLEWLPHHVLAQLKNVARDSQKISRNGHYPIIINLNLLLTRSQIYSANCVRETTRLHLIATRCIYNCKFTYLQCYQQLRILAYCACRYHDQPYDYLSIMLRIFLYLMTNITCDIVILTENRSIGFVRQHAIGSSQRSSTNQRLRKVASVRCTTVLLRLQFSLLLCWQLCKSKTLNFKYCNTCDKLANMAFIQN